MFDFVDEDLKLMDEASDYLPEEREEFLKWHGRTKKGFSGLDFGDNNSSSSGCSDAGDSFLGLIGLIFILLLIFSL